MVDAAYYLYIEPPVEEGVGRTKPIHEIVAFLPTKPTGALRSRVKSHMTEEGADWLVSSC